MKKLFGTLFIRCKAGNYKTRIYATSRSNQTYKVQTINQMGFGSVPAITTDADHKTFIG